jgi:hypothetical protein
VTTTTRAPCPACNKGPKDRALAITDDERGHVEYCHRCGYTSAENRVMAISVPVARPAYRPWQDLASKLWAEALPLHGSLAEKYLLARGCRLPPVDGDLKFLPGRGDHGPAMLARITDVVTNEPISLHFTRLALDGSSKAGTDRDKLLLKGHRKAGGVIRLWADSAVQHGLALAEGIETALSAAHAFSPIWATVDAGNLEAFPLLDGICALTIYADNDEAGIKASRACARRWRDAGREARIFTPREFNDVNDLIKDQINAAA